MSTPFYVQAPKFNAGYDGNDYVNNVFTLRLRCRSYSNKHIVIQHKFILSNVDTVYEYRDLYRDMMLDKANNLIRQLYRKSIQTAVKLKCLKYGIQSVRSSRRVNRRSGVFHKKRPARNMFIALYYSRHHVRTIRADRRRK